MASNQNQTSIRAVFGALFLALWLAALDQTVVSTALPTMVGDLGGLSYLSWVVTAYLLTSTVAGPLYGKFGDLYGRKIVLQVAISVFLVRPLRHRAEHAAADRVSRARRRGRRRTDRHHHRRDRRPHPAARARALSGFLRRGVRGCHHRRPPGRWLLRRSPELALDLLHQSADRHPRARGDRRRAAVALRAPPARGRLRGRAPAHHRA